MARDFETGSSDYGENTSAVLTAMPITIAAWVKPESVSLNHYILSLGVNAGNSAFNLKIDNDDTVRAQSTLSGASVAAATSTTVTAGTWCHAAAVFASATSRSAYLNGGGKGTNTTSNTPAGINRTTLGCRWDTSRSNFFDGLIAEAAIWSAALADDDIAALAKGVSPLLVRPEVIEAYWPLIGNYSPEIDLVGGFSFTLSGTATADHCRVAYPGRGLY